MADRPRETYADPATAAVLLAAEEIHEQVYELDSRVAPPLQAVFQGLTEAVYQWHEARELQDENESEGIRAGAVADLGDPSFAVNYAASVHRVIAAAEAVRAAVAADEAPAVSADGLPLLRALATALDRWEQQPQLAASWRQHGARPVLLHGVRAEVPSPDPPETPPPTVRPSTKAGSATEGDRLPGISVVMDRSGGGDTAARRQADDLSQRLAGADPADEPLGVPAPAPMEEDEEQWEAEVAQEIAEQARVRGAHAHL
jgi:hypothetical protein